ncbi:type II toxin-antitoxin system HicB family antitoxin [Lysinibacillus sp. NPDC095746]|uniref:type II toxin-antitoxin system HicB family antitoxin n=1 Tax=Lysinibacillus sp. NPDC095746 TaxID=3364134 RepID=UPI003806F9C9
MLKSYPAIFSKEDEGYSVIFPEFKGGTQGDDLEESMRMAQEFLAGIIAYYIDEDIELPKPSDINKLKSDNGFVTLIQADPKPYIRGNKTVRKNVTVPEWLVKKAEQSQINFSETLTEALYKKLEEDRA